MRRPEPTLPGAVPACCAVENAMPRQHTHYRRDNHSIRGDFPRRTNGRPKVKYATIDAMGDVMAFTDDDVEEGQEYRYRVRGGQRRRGGQEVHMDQHLRE